MPSAHLAADGHPERPAGTQRPAGRWHLMGLALLGLWSGLFVVAIALWVSSAFLSDSDNADRGLVRVVGAPFALVAVGLLWWAWRSARALRAGRRDGWTLLLVLGGVAVAQSVMTAPAVVGALGSAGSDGTAGAGAGNGPPPEMVTGMLVAIGFGLVSVVVAVLARRAWAAADAEADANAAETPAAPR